MACKAWPESTISHERRGMAQLHRTRTKCEAPLWTFRNRGGGGEHFSNNSQGLKWWILHACVDLYALILFNSRPPPLPPLRKLPPPRPPPHQLPPLQLPPPPLSPIPQQSAVGSNRSDRSDRSDCYKLGGGLDSWQALRTTLFQRGG